MPDISLKGKTIVLGISGGIAAYKMPNVAHKLVKLGGRRPCVDDQACHRIHCTAGV